MALRMPYAMKNLQPTKIFFQLRFASKSKTMFVCLFANRAERNGLKRNGRIERYNVTIFWRAFVFI